MPASYSNVPAVSVKGLCEVPHRTCTFKSLDVLQEAQKEENDWCNIGVTLSNGSFGNTPVSWAAHHASRHPLPTKLPSKAISALLPIFLEKVDTLAMVKHGIAIIIGSTNFLNPGQVSILACDCPIFAQPKLIQWRILQLR